MTIRVVRNQNLAGEAPVARVHQFNSNALRLTHTLTERLGLERLGLHRVTVPPGRDSTQHHFHEADEEFLLILEGRGIATIGETSITVGPGDFLGFGAPSDAHSLHNPGPQPLVYLMGGEGYPHDVTHYPRIGRTMLKSHGTRRVVHTAALKDLG